MGRNKYSAGEIKEIGKLLRLKNAGNRLQQKLIPDPRPRAPLCH